MNRITRVPIEPSGFLAGLLVFFFTSAGWSQPSQTAQTMTPRPPAPPQAMTVQQVRGNIYQIKGGSGANTGFFIGRDEVIVIDSKMTGESAKQMIAEIQKLTPNPIRKVLLTHSDRDHVNGLPAFPPGTMIISHEETLRYMDGDFKGDTLRAFLPDITFASRAAVYSDTARIEMLYFGPAHTSGDAVILFPGEKVAFVGDLLMIGRDPLIHLAKNGSSFGLVKVLNAILKLDADIFVSGHAEIAGRPEIEAEIRSVEEKQARVKELVKQNKTLDEVKKAFGVAEGGRWPSFYEVIYRELTEKECP
jgi:cyclase